MNSHALVPLIATIAYIPLLVILLANRPWDRKQRFFFLFLIPVILWSLGDLFFRSDFLMQDKILIAEVVLCIMIWMLIQFHYFLSSYYQPQRIKIPLAYIFLVSAITLALLGYIPRGIEVTASGINVDYGIWIIVIGLLFLFNVGAKDIHSLLRRYKISPDSVERNQITYLFGTIAILAVFLLCSTTPRGGEYPVAHIGNLITAVILTYAVIAHHLLDVRVVFRRGVIWLSVCIVGAWAYVGLFFLAQRLIGFDINRSAIIAGGSIAILVAVFFYWLIGALGRRMEQSLVGERYDYRRRLFDFTHKIDAVSTLKEFGDKLVPLLSESVGCQRACLFLPQAKEGDFVARSSYPLREDNPMQGLKLRRDSPIVTWLRQKDKILTDRELATLPEFQSMWQEEKEQIQSANVEMFLPLINNGELVAVLAIGNKQHNKLYTVEDIDLMKSVAARVAAGMEKEYLHERIRERDEELTLVNRLTAIITSSMNIRDIFESFVKELKRVISVDYVTIALIEEDQLYIVALSSEVPSVRQAGERIPLDGTTTEWVSRERKTLYEAALMKQRRFWTAERYIQEGIRSIVHLPLIAKDEVIGSLIIASYQPDAYSKEEIRLLEHLASQIATPVKNSQLYLKAEQRSRVDDLTGLFNRRYFEEQIKDDIARCSRYGGMFSLLMLDLDNFKAYNDIYGHPSGDKLLNQIGRIIRDSIRSADRPFRYGGDEFIVVLPETKDEDACVVAERVRKQVVDAMEAKQAGVTCSIGLASYPSDGVLPDELVTAADTALYHAKETGGNHVYLASKILSEPVEKAGMNARYTGLSVVYALASAVDTRDPYIYGHSRKVNAYSVALAEALGLPPETVSRISTAALLHDVGKIGIPDELLNKDGELSDADWYQIKLHPRLGANIVGNVPNLVPCLGGILYHHERWDGNGYPEGLKGESIPLDARILAIADAFDAMTSARPYHHTFSREEALEELGRGAGTQFDPELAKVFINVVKAGLPLSVK